MTKAELAITRITPKLNSENFKKVVRYVNSIFDRDTDIIDVIKNSRDLDSDNSFVLDELGKLFGIEKRPTITATGTAGGSVFAYDLTAYDVAAYTDEEGAYRELTNSEYSRLLKAVAVLNGSDGSVGSWELAYSAVGGGYGAYILNDASVMNVNINYLLSPDEKKIVQIFQRLYNPLTVSVNLTSTTAEGTMPFIFGVTPFGYASFITPW